jgi:putative molybdopterin biosynthesis protein
MSSSEALMTPLEVAKYLQKSKSWVYAAVERGELPVCRVGRDLRFERGDLERWVASKKQLPAPTMLKSQEP